MKHDKLTRRVWTGTWIEPVQERAWHTPQLDFAGMVAAEKNGVPGEETLRCARHLHRVVSLENEDGDLPVSAVIYASAHGVYELYLNGVKADGRLLAPETTNYEKLLWYQVYDITELADGSDRLCIDVLLGDGWWIGRLGMSGSSCNYGDRLGFIMDLELTYPDGSVKTVGSDERFLSCASFIRYSDLYIGEMQDGRAFDFIDGLRGCPPRERIMDAQYRLHAPKEDEEPVRADWTACIRTKAPTHILAKQPGQPVTVIGEIPCRGFIEDPDGELVADLGQVLAGVVRITVRAERGTVFTLEHGEVLGEDGRYRNNIKGLYKDQKVRYVCGGGDQTFVPHFTYQGFRYVRIRGISKDQILELTALRYGTELRTLGHFETDDPLLNGLQHAIEQSTLSNMVSIPTDCPQREKLGWTGDIRVFTPTGAFLYDLRSILGRWLLLVRLEQAQNGEIPVVVPNHPSQEQIQRGMSGGTNSSAAWSDCIVFMPLSLYQIYGDLSFLEESYDAMERWMSYVAGEAKDDLWRGRFHFGDWLIPSLREEADGVMKGVAATADITGSCYYSLAAQAMQEICTILNRPDRAAHYRKLTERINEALVRTYVYPDGRVGVHAADSADGDGAQTDRQLQGLYVMMLKSGAVKDPVRKRKMTERLVGLIREAGNTLDCGFASIGFLLDVLYENGYREVAYQLLFQTNAPSWLYMIRHGATSIWENWRAIEEDGTVTDSSYDHYAYGCVGDFMYRHIGGIAPLEPGYRSVRIAPDLDCGIRKSLCTRHLPKEYGEGASDRRIVCRWELDEQGGGRVHVEIPEGVTAQIELPGQTGQVGAGSYDFTV